MCVYQSTSCFISCIWFLSVMVGTSTVMLKVCSFFQSQRLTGPLRGEDWLNNVAGVERWSGVMLCLNPASLRNCEGDAGYEAMTPDPRAVTESANANGHLCTSLSGCGLLAKPHTLSDLAAKAFVIVGDHPTRKSKLSLKRNIDA